MKIYSELYQRLYDQSNDNSQILDYETEYGFYKAVALGNADEVERYRQHFKANKPIPDSKSMRSVLSMNNLQNQKYHFAILVSMLSRSCVETGLPRATAYAISDIYILKADSCTSSAQLLELQDNAINDFVKIMQLRRKENIYSKQVAQCIDCIHADLHEKITLEGLANKLSISPNHLSRLFSKEVGQTFSAYVLEYRIITASKLLLYTQLSISEISELFHFSSQSHFTTAFKDHFKMTPKKFRDKNFSKSVAKLS